MKRLYVSEQRTQNTRSKIIIVFISYYCNYIVVYCFGIGNSRTFYVSLLLDFYLFKILMPCLYQGRG